MLLILAEVESIKALVDQEGKLERQNRAESSLNQNKGKYRESKECRNLKRRPKDIIKIGVYNINSIKGDSIKLEQLAEFGKAERYNIIRIIKTNIEEYEDK